MQRYTQGLRLKLAPCENLSLIPVSLKGEDGGSGSGKVLVLEQVLIVA